MDRNSADFVEINDFKVALRKESVDRNINRNPLLHRYAVSLSARRAWIEILLRSSLSIGSCSRSPQGERG